MNSLQKGVVASNIASLFPVVALFFAGKLLRHGWAAILFLISGILSVYYHMCWTDSPDAGFCAGARQWRTDAVPPQWVPDPADPYTYSDYASQQRVAAVLESWDILFALLSASAVGVWAYEMWWAHMWGDGPVDLTFFGFEWSGKSTKADVALFLYTCVTQLATVILVVHFGLTLATVLPLMVVHGLTFVFTCVYDWNWRHQSTKEKDRHSWLWWAFFYVLGIGSIVTGITLYYFGTTSNPDNTGYISDQSLLEHLFRHAGLGLFAATLFGLTYDATTKGVGGRGKHPSTTTTKMKVVYGTVPNPA